MGDHFVLLVDRLLTESSLAAAIESRNQALEAEEAKRVEFFSYKKVVNDGSPTKIVECRICQDEDEDSNMETPCSCCGSLKYAHRKCVQKWCNEKGDTKCEICHQQFKPGYTAPPRLFHYGGVPMTFRGNWEISRRDLHNPRFLAMVSSDRDLLDSDYDDYSVHTTSSLICCRAVAIIFMILLILRHTLPIIISGNEEYSMALVMLLLLRTAGILIPIYVMVKAVAAVQHCRNQQSRESPSLSSSEDGDEDEETHLQPQPHIIRVQ